MLAESACKEYKKYNVPIVALCLCLKVPLTHVLHVRKQVTVKEVMRDLVVAAVVTAINFLLIVAGYKTGYYMPTT
jgi:hypothetical protein